jgi:hypothetical protein
MPILRIWAVARPEECGAHEAKTQLNSNGVNCSGVSILKLKSNEKKTEGNRQLVS